MESLHRGSTALLLLTVASLAHCQTSHAAEVWHRVTSRSISVSIPASWRRVAPLQPPLIDREAVITVGSPGVRPGKPECAFGFYSIPPAGAAVIVIATPQFPAPRRSVTAAVLSLVLRKDTVECWYHHRAGAVVARIDGHGYEIAVLVGDAASPSLIGEARRVAGSIQRSWKSRSPSTTRV